MLTTLLALPVLLGAPQWPGPKTDGSTLLTNGWSLAPHGAQIELPSDLPIRMALDPSGRFLAVQHAGYREHRVAIVDTASDRVVAQHLLGKTWSGLAWSPSGRELWVSGGVEDELIHLAFDPAAPALQELGRVRVDPLPGAIDLPAGLAFDGAGRLFVALQRGNRIVRLDAGARIDLELRLPDDSFPFECQPSRDGATIYVSLWGRREVRAFDAASGEPRFVARAGEHPSEMVTSPDGRWLYVSNGNENTVSVIDLARGELRETLGSALYPASPPGSTPNALALARNGGLLLVANADNNNCAVLDVSEPGRSQSLGFIPLGWYPTSIRFSADGGKVYALNGKGSAGSRANPKGPGPMPGRPQNLAEYVGGMFTGSLSVFEFPQPAELQQLSQRAYRCAPLDPAAAARAQDERPADSPIPAKVGDPSPIRHCIYVIKENRTYDQVLGAFTRDGERAGNGDPELCLFGEEVTPNHHAIAREFVLLDNFYVESEVSADGHEWTMGAYATDFVERTWPVTYGGKGTTAAAGGRALELGYPSEGRLALARPKNGYLWDLA